MAWIVRLYSKYEATKNKIKENVEVGIRLTKETDFSIFSLLTKLPKLLKKDDKRNKTKSSSEHSREVSSETVRETDSSK